jgi:hypothetical protein
MKAGKKGKKKAKKPEGPTFELCMTEKEINDEKAEKTE